MAAVYYSDFTQHIIKNVAVFIITFLVNRYFQVVMLIMKAMFVDKSTAKTSPSIILSFKLPKNVIAFSCRRNIAL